MGPPPAVRYRVKQRLTLGDKCAQTVALVNIDRTPSNNCLKRRLIDDLINFAIRDIVYDLEFLT